jgi:hypothetical protein
LVAMREGLTGNPAFPWHAHLEWLHGRKVTAKRVRVEMNFFAPDPLLDERARAAIGLAEELQYSKLVEPITQKGEFATGVADGFEEMERCRRCEPNRRRGAKPVHGSPHDQRHSRGNWIIGTGSGERYLRAGEGFSSGRDSHSHADSCNGGSAREPGGAGLDPASACAAFRTMAEAGEELEGKAKREATGGNGDLDVDPGGTRDMDASNGSSDRAAAQRGLGAPPFVSDQGSQSRHELPSIGAHASQLKCPDLLPIEPESQPATQ